MVELGPDLRAALRASLRTGCDELERALSEAPPVSVRLNPTKPAIPIGASVPWCRQGRYLHERPIFTLDPCFHAGAYYVQEASSMSLELAFAATGLADQAIVALDLCAAPGGKSTHLRSLMSPGSLLVSNEVEGRRASVLQENLWKWGMPNVVICNDRPEHFGPLSDLFDLVLVDAPCSGEGLMRKDAYAIEQWSTALVKECTVRQTNILDAIWPTVKPGGYLVYSTCTYEASENEDQMERCIGTLGAEHVQLDGIEAYGMMRGKGDIGVRCYPHRLKGEGFYMALLRKPGRRSEEHPRSGAAAGKPVPEEVVPWLRSIGALSCIEHNDVLHCSSVDHAAMIDRIAATVRCLAPGAPVAERRGAGWIPHAALALCPALLSERIERRELNKEEALQYLRGESLRAASAEGHALATHRDLPLGWLKGAGNRWNNRYPAPWRIRMR